MSEKMLGMMAIIPILVMLASCETTGGPGQRVSSTTGGARHVAMNHMDDDGLNSNEMDIEEEPVITDIKPVAYTCTYQNDKKKITVLYGINENKIVASQIKLGAQKSEVMYFVPSERGAGTLNIYKGKNYQWVTDIASANNVHKVNARVYSRINNTSMGATVLHDCTLDRAATNVIGRKYNSAVAKNKQAMKRKAAAKKKASSKKKVVKKTNIKKKPVKKTTKKAVAKKKK